MKLSGTPDQIVNAIGIDMQAVMARVRAHVQPYRREIYEYQGLVLYALARNYNRVGARILELGTAYGFSAACMAEAAPLAKIVTLNPKNWEAETARTNLRHYSNVTVDERYSWDFLETLVEGDLFDLIFVDADHKQIWRDLPYWNHLDEGGLFLHHDYSPNESARACPPVYRALNAFRDWLGRDFDVLVVDDQSVGLAGWYKRAGDPALSEVTNG